MSCRFKWGSKSCHLIDDTSCTPDVALFVVLLIVNLLWRHIVWGTDMSIGEDGVLIHDSGEPEITKLDVLALIQEDIPRLQISMKNLTLFAIVASTQSSNHL